MQQLKADGGNLQIQARFGAKLELKLQIKTNRHPRIPIRQCSLVCFVAVDSANQSIKDI